MGHADIVLTERDDYQRVQSSMAGTDKMEEMLDNNSRFSRVKTRKYRNFRYSKASRYHSERFITIRHKINILAVTAAYYLSFLNF